MKLKIKKSISTEELVEKCRRQHPGGQKALYDKLSGQMLAVCLRYINDRSEAEHVMVGGFIKVFDNIGNYRGDGCLEGWVRKIMVNEALGYLRKYKAMSVEVEIEQAYAHADVSDTLSDMHADELIEMVGQLPVGYRTVLNLYAIEGYSHKEISNMLNISEGTSKSQLNRARNLLKQRLCLTNKIIEPNEQN